MYGLSEHIKKHYEGIDLPNYAIHDLGKLAGCAISVKVLLNNVTHDVCTPTLLSKEELDVLRRAVEILNRMDSDINSIIRQSVK